ncbi:hypothetical protein BS78_03G146000 [Paspalum vaginatum]|nr:hypothetical protein BS78_03G146000 [Paspalum vaginatum]
MAAPPFCLCGAAATHWIDGWSFQQPFNLQSVLPRTEVLVPAELVAQPWVSVATPHSSHERNSSAAHNQPQFVGISDGVSCNPAAAKLLQA